MNMVPMSKVEGLPKWNPPNNVRDAATIISKLGKNLHEHAYVVGRHLLWVKKEVAHGTFLPWIEQNIWFGSRTSTNMMRYAERCIKAEQTLEYHPRKSETVSDLRTKKKTKKKESEPSSWDKLMNADPLMRYESELADCVRGAFDRWPTDQRDNFFKTMEWVLNELRDIN